jgi:hypothetical protein
MANHRNQSTTGREFEQRDPLDAPLNLNTRSDHMSAARVPMPAVSLRLHLHTGEPSTQSNERPTICSARVTPASRLPQRANVPPVLQRTAQPTHAHTGIGTRTSQRNRTQARAGMAESTSSRAQVDRSATRATQATRSAGQRRYRQDVSVPAQQRSDDQIRQSNSIPDRPGAAPPSASHESLREEFHRAFDVFTQPFIQNHGSVTTSGSTDVSVPGVEVRVGSMDNSVNGRVVSEHGPMTPTTTGLNDILLRARNGLTRAMEVTANFTGYNLNHTAQRQGAPASSRPGHSYTGRQVNRASVVEHQRREAAENRIRAERQRLEAAANDIRALREELRARVQRRTSLPTYIEHFTALPNDESSDTDCMICQEPYDNNEHAAIQLQNVTCTHIFGRACLQKWVNGGLTNAHRCPSCRQDISGALARAASTPQPLTVKDPEFLSRLQVPVTYTPQAIAAEPRHVRPDGTFLEGNTLRKFAREIRLDARLLRVEARAEARAEALDARYAARMLALVQETVHTIREGVLTLLQGTVGSEQMERGDFDEYMASGVNERYTAIINHQMEQFTASIRRRVREIQEREAEDDTLPH